MCKYLMLSSVLVLGTGLTTICAGVGLDRLLTFSGGPRRASPPGLTKTVLIRMENVDADEAAEVLRKHALRRRQVGVNQSEQLVRITGTPQQVERLKRILYEIDSPPIGRLPVGPIREVGR